MKIIQFFFLLFTVCFYMCYLIYGTQYCEVRCYGYILLCNTLTHNLVATVCLRSVRHHWEQLKCWETGSSEGFLMHLSDG